MALVLAAGLALLYLAEAQVEAQTGKRPSIAIEQVAVVDVIQGAIVRPRTVLVVDGQISAVGEPETITLPPEAVRVDGRGHFLMPGLVDMHVHLFNNASRRPPNEWAFRLFVANGVTGVREMGTDPAGMATVENWRNQADRGDLVAPRVLAAGVAVGGKTPEGTRRQVWQAKSSGADFIKVFSEVRQPEWRAIMDEAVAVGLPVCGHIPAEISLLEAATAGQRSNEHLTQVYEACTPREKEWLDARRKAPDADLIRLREHQERRVVDSFDPTTCEHVATRLGRTEQVQVPTLVLPFFESRGVPGNFRDDPHWRYLRTDEQARWERIFKEGYPLAGDKLAARRWDISRRIVRTLNSASVRILAGTDSPMPRVYPGFSLHKELELLVESGLTSADALRTATIWPVEFLGLSRSLGSIAPGKRADLVLLNEDPLADIRHTQSIQAIVLDGRLLQRPDLNQLLNVAAGGDNPRPAASPTP